MLLLSRRVGQEVVIGDHVRVRVVAVRGKCVRLAFAAPESVPIHREEIHRKRLEFAPSAPSMEQVPAETT